MSAIYFTKHGILRGKRYEDKAELRDTITELQLTKSLLQDELNACKEFIRSKDRQIVEKDRQIRKLELKIEHLRLDLAIADRSLDIATEEQNESKS